jgi:hypothetical protein
LRQRSKAGTLWVKALLKTENPLGNTFVLKTESSQKLNGKDLTSGSASSSINKNFENEASDSEEEEKFIKPTG